MCVMLEIGCIVRAFSCGKKVTTDVFFTSEYAQHSNIGSHVFHTVFSIIPWYWQGEFVWQSGAS